MIESSQNVKLFDDSDKMGIQDVVIDNENWMIVNHDGSEISLSLENWLKLVSLANSVIEESTSTKTKLLNCKNDFLNFVQKNVLQCRSFCTFVFQNRISVKNSESKSIRPHQ